MGAMMADPSAMFKMMKNNFLFMGTNMGMMGFITTFFSGFLLRRL